MWTKRPPGNDPENITFVIRFLHQICLQLEATGKLSKEHSTGMIVFLKSFLGESDQDKRDAAQIKEPAARDNVKGMVPQTLLEDKESRSLVKIINEAFSAYTPGNWFLSRKIVEHIKAYISWTANHVQHENNV